MRASLNKWCKIGPVTPFKPIMDPEAVERVKRALTDSAYTAPQIEAAFERPMLELVHAGYRGELSSLTDAEDPQHTLIRLFLAGKDEPETHVAAAGGLPVEAMINAGILERVSSADVRARIRIQPHGQWWAVSDLPVPHNGHTESDAVLAVGPSSAALAHYSLEDKVDTALDIGTGCGVQALHLSQHATTVTATDLSRRALQFAATTAALNDMDWELLYGDLVAPVENRRFDQIVCNPPVSVGPGIGRWLYRDSSEPGDAMVTRLAEAAPRLLTESGVMQFMAHWPERADSDWQDYLASWIPPGFDAWIIRSSSVDPETYVNDWLTRSSEDQTYRGEWLIWLHKNKIDSVGRGMVTLRWSHGPQSAVRIEPAHPLPSGAEVAQWIRGRDWMRDQHWRSFTYRLAEDAVLLRQGQRISLQKLYSLPVRGALLRYSYRSFADAGQVELSCRGRTMPATCLAIDICGDATKPGSRRLGDLLDEWNRRNRQDPALFEQDSVETITRLLERGILIPDDACWENV